MRESTLLDLPFETLRDRLAELGEPAYRADQIWRAVYHDFAIEYGAMTTLPVGLRSTLASGLPFDSPSIEATQESSDRRTSKSLLRLADGASIEVVSMHYDDRRTVCVSTQIGCAMGCRICATGQAGFVRDLSVGEIVAQVLHAARGFREHDRRLSNVVYMGMGEPLANYEATLGSIRMLNDPRGLGLGARSFTVSTVGHVLGIERLASEDLQVNLAVSLHAAEDELRTRLLPINETYPIDRLLEACRTYLAKTNRRITFEVALIDGVNDSPDHARRLSDLLRGLLCHVNLIPLNPVPGCAWKRSPNEHVDRFSSVLRQRGIPVSVRVRRGIEIQAGCGQLRAANESRETGYPDSSVR